MKIVSMHSHDFEKQNLVTLQNGGDAYKCKICQCSGIRTSIDPYIKVTEAEYNKSIKCSYKQKLSDKPKRVLLDTMHHIGIEEGIYDVIECPSEYKDKYEDDIWVFSEKRNEPIRILPFEIIDKEF